MNISAKYSNLKHWKTECTAVFLPKHYEQPTWLAELQEIFGNIIDKLIKGKEFGAEEDAAVVLYGNTKTNSKRVILIGLGEMKNFEWDTLRRGAAKAIRTAHQAGIEKCALAFPAFLVKDGFPENRVAQCLVEGAMLANYRYDHYQTDKQSKKTSVDELALITEYSPRDAVMEGIETGRIVSQAVHFARDLGNAPGNELPPRELADRAASMCRRHKIKCSVFNETKLKSLKMNGLLAVSQGSSEPPRMIVMEYRHPKAKNHHPIALVGKGLTFDSGGISIKPAADMDRMKFDMCGGAAVIGTMQAIADMKLPLYVVGIVPSSENLTGSKAYKPGDVLTMYSGKTVEILNTDAEGRLILADALAYAQKYKPETIVDFATLTGHVVIALGSCGAGMMGTDEKMKKRLMEASNFTSEKIWELPLWKEYERQIKSHIADIKNTGGRPAGAITAAAFLKQFVGDYPWVHIDIAGTANTEEETAYTGKVAATGFGIRLMVETLQQYVTDKE